MRISAEMRNNLNAILPLLLLVLLLVLVASCTPGHPQSTFGTHGPVAQRQMTLFYVIFWAAVFVFVTVGGTLLFAAIRFRRRPGQPEPPQTHGNTRLEIGWTIAPAVVLFVVAIPTVLAQFYISDPPSDEDKLDVNVTAHQWWWEIEYPGLGVVTANEIHVPVNENVEFTLTSDDVVHSFWVPKLAGKMDIFPGKTTRMWFRADSLDSNLDTPERGPFFGQCAEFCGIAHSWMRFRVWVDTPEEFQAWVDTQLAQAHTPDSPEAEEGAQLFLSKGCVACHTVNGVPGAVGVRGPNLTHFGNRSTLAAGVKDLNDENLRAWLKDPDDIKEGTIMAREAPVYTNPSLSLSDGDISALVAYLNSLK
ncbi:MAG: cytochrome c oxidase subunit II [Chloroflexi bacterium]|nr:cytochrome c oxidase subunit II [Chloroflexota bacterium]